jgi:hypothetical protein
MFRVERTVMGLATLLDTFVTPKLDLYNLKLISSSYRFVCQAYNFFTCCKSIA